MKDYLKNRPGELSGTLVLSGIIITAMLMSGSEKGCIIFGMALAGQLAQWILSFAGVRKAVVPALLFLAARTQAIIPVAIALGVAVVLLGLGAIAIWSKALSVQIRNAAKPIEHAARSVVADVSDVAMARVTPSPSQVDIPAMLAAAPKAVRPSMRLFVPAGTTLRRSTNLVDWEVIAQPSEDSHLEIPYDLEMEFFRLE